MINFLKEENISDETISLLEKNKTSNELFDLSLNKVQILKIIKYLKSINIKNIEELLINETYIFYKVASDIKIELSKYEEVPLAEAINNNYEIIEQII